METIVETERLIVRKIDQADAEFMLTLLNQPSFIQFIGDRCVRTVDQAKQYIIDRVLKSYDDFGFGPYAITSKENQRTVGLNGLIKRETLDDVDIGFAFLTEFCGHGYALESSLAILKYARNELKLEKVVAIARKDNDSSLKLIKRLKMEEKGMIRLKEDEPELCYFSLNL